ncbi:protein CLP1 homolog isoform X1 [Dendrobium catenatum]|uniref:Protein CLP1 homolog n=1 Tax=Dendrobium catenatum TaxID=906689 RepID=A0A2I0X933_9ASPA|nr:protein CLP1 homolog isoform X1 [Dendrobium catenatum]PKU84390.1 Protein CLP1 like [Dendrobium catenatum]
MSANDGATMASSRQFVLEKESELRVEVGPEATLRLRLTAGAAEVFGAELPPEKWITVPAFQNIAIFTWKGATIELDGISEVEYVADETPMVSYVNVHAILDGRRTRARTGNSQGPRTIVVGPTDSGKSSLCRMLLNWACKRSWKPTLVDLDIGQGSISMPGCIAASSVEMPMDAFWEIPTEMPVVYFYGHTSASANVELYKVLMKELAQTLEKRFSCISEYEVAGMVINTMGWTDGLGYELLLQAINIFNADVVLVLGQEKLFSMLKDVLKSKPHVDIVKLHKSEGVVLRNQKVRQMSRSYRIREYFYGLNNDLSPYSLSMNFGDISVFRIGGPQAPRSALPIGAEPLSDPTRAVIVNINYDLVHAILAISYAKESDQILSSNIAGFLYVAEIDFESKRITFLAPCPAELPSKLLVMGTLKWSEN